ncbi:Uncharacterized protein TCM_007838 [Theobroma cacao]|uniref:Uncharacterized protein n=1 Tax=Theobroma cacao TaxID=3641 RepID=A0A061EAF0_THECC|nr:Uncharacterized protein TCM_007838 [Theobroma cacao]
MYSTFGRRNSSIPVPFRIPCLVVKQAALPPKSISSLNRSLTTFLSSLDCPCPVFISSLNRSSPIFPPLLVDLLPLSQLLSQLLVFPSLSPVFPFLSASLQPSSSTAAIVLHCGGSTGQIDASTARYSQGQRQISYPTSKEKKER